MAVDPDLIDALTATIADLYREVETALIRTVAQRLRQDPPLPSPYQETKLEAVQALRRSAQAILAAVQAARSEVVRQAVADAYRHGQGAALADLPERWFPRSGIGQAARTAIRDTLPNATVIENLAAALHRDLGRVDGNILRAPLDAYRAVQAGAAARIATGAYTRLEASQAAWQQLVNKGIVTFADRGGRVWRLSSYVEMIARTNIQRAAIQGQADRLTSIGMDLVIVSNAPQECKLCRPFEGKILAISGPTGKVQVEHATRDGVMVTVDVLDTLDGARAKGFQHPNCRHSVSAYQAGITKIPTHTADPEGDKARQKQRALERKIRAAKEQAEAALTDEARKAANAKVRAAQAELRAHLEAHPTLKRLRYREQIGAGNIPKKPGGPSGGPVGDLQPPVQPTLDGGPAPRPGATTVPEPPARPAAPARGQLTLDDAQTVRRDEPTVRQRTAEQPPARPYHRTLDGIEDLAAAVRRAGDGERTALSGGQSATTELVRLPDGTRLVRKVGMDWGDPDEVAASIRTQADAEQLTSLLGRAIGAPVAKVYRQDVGTVWLEWIEGDVIGARPDARALVDGRDGKLLGLLDHLTANADRNSGNIMVTPDGRLVGIDHGWSFGEHNLGQTDSVIQDEPGRPAWHYSRDGRWVDNPLTAADVAELRRRLEALREDFALVGRGAWLDHAMMVLDQLARHAKGTVNLIA